MSRRTRLVLIPAVLFAVVSGTVYVLAEQHPAKDEAAPAPQPGSAAARGEDLFAENCASCHGEGGAGGGIGPALAGSGVTAAEARTAIETGPGAMPEDLVAGEDLESVLAYLETIAR